MRASYQNTTKPSRRERSNCALHSSFYCESGHYIRRRIGSAAGALFSSWARLSVGAALAIGLWAAPSQAAQSQHEAQTPDPKSSTRSSIEVKHPLKVLVFGDSISAAYGISRKEGWASLLQTRLALAYPTAKVINASVSGETTQGGRARLQAALERHDPHLVFVELGGNDALRGYPVALMRDNLAAMVAMAQSGGARVVLLGMQIPPNYGPRYTREFAAAFKTVAAATQAHLVPFFLEGVALVDGMIQEDGIHPTAAAQPTMLETGWTALVDCLVQDYPLLKGPEPAAASPAAN